MKRLKHQRLVRVSDHIAQLERFKQRYGDLELVVEEAGFAAPISRRSLSLLTPPGGRPAART